MTDEEARKLAEEHWVYTETIIKLTRDWTDNILALMKYLYVEAMVHGIKHQREER